MINTLYLLFTFISLAYILCIAYLYSEKGNIAKTIYWCALLIVNAVCYAIYHR